jgi:hypothetical protein
MSGGLGGLISSYPQKMLQRYIGIVLFFFVFKALWNPNLS